MEAIVKTRKIGGSLIVTILKAIVEHEGLTEDQAVKIDIKKIKKSRFGMFKGIGTFTKEDKLKGQLEKK
ncbi:hypothetical protein J4440_00815 [Candidatus Woesearchaeota archaeon]|nr:hypothetical protein [Candidatus Woesearchaeota archaeon]